MEDLPVILVQVLEDSVGVGVQVKGHQERVEEVQTIIVDFDETLQ